MPKTRTSNNDGRGQVLVAIVNNERDFAIARNEHWYRIPVASVRKRLKQRWPPLWLAFYQTKVFGTEAHSVRYYARVLGIREVTRADLFPEEGTSEKTGKQYYQLTLSALETLPTPILSARWRRIVFIPTTWLKFVRAAEINDLYDDSPLEDRLWAALKRHEIQAQRQYFVTTNGGPYALDFAIFCDRGKIDAETDGDSWHADPGRIPLDNRRDNALTALGWSVLRFNGRQIREETGAYCIPKIVESVNRLGGVTGAGVMPQVYWPEDPDGARQLALFEERVAYELD